MLQITEKQIGRIFGLKRAGGTPKQIAIRTGIPRSMVIEILRSRSPQRAVEDFDAFRIAVADKQLTAKEELEFDAEIARRAAEVRAGWDEARWKKAVLERACVVEGPYETPVIEDWRRSFVRSNGID